MKKIIIAFALFSFAISTNSQIDSNIKLGLSSPANGVKINANFPTGKGGWARGFHIADQASKPFITFGTYGSYDQGVSSPIYSYIGKAYNNAFMVFNPNGNIGIGTNSPTRLLEIRQKNDPNTDYGLMISEPSNDQKVYLHLANNAGGQYGYLGLGGETILRGNGQTSSFDGKLGIGTKSPVAKLGVVYSTTDNQISKNGITINRSTVSTTNKISYDKGIYSSIGNISIAPNITDSGYKIGMDASSFSKTDNLKGRLNNNWAIWARAGIYKATTGARINSAIAVNAQVLDNVTGTTIDNIYGVKISTNDYKKSTVTNRYDLYAGTTAAKNYFAGKVGIGTTNIPTDYKLAVVGKIITEEVKVQLKANWPDFVFKKEYELPKLAEVENHIKEKGHLQNIPSAKEVKKEGFFLGGMDAKLLQKIEELTLYTIQQEKKLEKQNKDIEELKTLVKQLIEAKK